MKAFRIVAAMAALLALLVGCQQYVPQPLRPGVSLAVARFTNPQNTWELLAGCLPDQCVLLDPKILFRADEMLAQALAEAGRTNYAPPSVVRQCEAADDTKDSVATRQAAFRTWLAAGQCVPADYLLVPQLQVYRERDMADEKPASVTMDFFLLDVKNQRILRRFRFEETQQPLMSNILEMDKFVSRGGRWITAEELANEGIVKAVKELGL